MRLLLFAACTSLSILAGPVWGQEAATLGASFQNAKVSLRTQQGREIAKDYIRVNLIASANGPDWENLNGEVSSIVDQLKKDVSAYPGLQLVLGNRITNVSEKLASDTDPQITGWRVDQDIILGSTNPDAIYKFLQTTRPGIIVANIGYSISQEAQTKVEAEVTQLALFDVHARAKQIQEAVGANGFSVIEMDVATQLTDQPKPPAPSMVDKTEATAEGARAEITASMPSPSTVVVTTAITAVIQITK